MLCPRGLLIKKCLGVHMPLRPRSRRQIFRFTDVIIQQSQSNISSDSKTMEIIRPNVKITDRLNPLVRPLNYNLELRPDLDQGEFQGRVKIDVVTKQDRQFISLHSKFLNLTNVKVHKGTDEIAVSKFYEIPEVEQLFIHFDSPLSPGNYKICIEFNGDLTRDIVGFYSSRLLNSR